MPELPEVETVRRALAPRLLGRAITGAAALRPQVIARPAPEIFCRRVSSSVIERLGRRGKFLIIRLAGGAELIVHLRMTGQLFCAPAGHPRAPHTHVIFTLDDGWELRFIDTRRFGRLWLKEAGEEDTFSGIGKLGPEPFDECFGAEHLKQKLGGRRVAVKQGLLDQTAVSGIGNIYADESLFAAKLDPRRLTGDLTVKQWRTLAAAIRRVLEKAIADNAVSPEEYLATEGKKYKNNYFSVYGREGEKCCRCGAAIQKIKIAGRGSCFCPKCQKQ